MMVYQHIFIFTFLLWSFCNGSTNAQTSTTCTLESVTEDLNYLVRHTNAVLKCAEEVIGKMPDVPEDDPSCPIELPSYIRKPIHDCINCLSHAQLGHANLKDFAQVSITKEYWKKAGSPSINPKLKEDLAYKACILSENCILNAIKNYTDAPGKKDCNKDGVVDCKDRFWIHVYGEKCLYKKNAFNYGYTVRLAACLSI